MADELRLNSLDRFRKHPERLVLQAYSHCEVPAGCGGVVLRWRNPLAAVPVTISLYAPVPAACFLDGVAPNTARVDLAPGSHVLAITVPNADLDAGLLMFAAIYDPKKDQPVPPLALREMPLNILSAADGSWKFSVTEPADDWRSPEFDDRGWPALVEQQPTPQIGWGEFNAASAKRCIAAGASFLRLPGPSITDDTEDDDAERPVAWWQKLLGWHGTPLGDTGSLGMGMVCIRKRFDVPRPVPAEEMP